MNRNIDSGNIEIVKGNWAIDPTPMQEIRTKVFLREQKVPEELEWDGEDSGATHFVAMDGKKAIGTVRLLTNGHIGRMAVIKEYRNLKIGSRLLESCEKQAQAMGKRKVVLDAQKHAIPFYQHHGYKITSEDFFMDAGIPHKTMEKSLQASNRAPVLNNIRPRNREINLAAIKDLKLGEHAERLSCTTLEGLQAHVIHMSSQSRRCLSIFTQSLEHDLYDTDLFAENLSQMVRNYRYNRVRVLTIDFLKAEKEGHQLVDLSRRLPSYIQIRKVAREHNEIKDSYLIADEVGLIFRNNANDYKAIVGYSAPTYAQGKQQIFDEIWERGSEIKAFRNLSL